MRDGCVSTRYLSFPCQFPVSCREPQYLREARQRDDEARRHRVLIGDEAHQHRRDSASHDRHHQIRRSLLGMYAHVAQRQREDRREHDRLAQEAQQQEIPSHATRHQDHHRHADEGARGAGRQHPLAPHAKQACNPSLPD